MRVADKLKSLGCPLPVDQFRRVLLDVKEGMFPGISIDELLFTRDEADIYCREIRRRLQSPRMTRVFILRSLMGVRKGGPVAAKV